MLEKEIDQFISTLRDNGAKAIEWLNAGTSKDDNLPGFEGVAVHPDLRTLWSKFAGMTVPAGTLSEYTWLDGQFCYLTVEEAVSDYRVTLDLHEKEPFMEEYWPKGFLPFGSVGEGSFLVINCLHGSPTNGAIYDMTHGIGVRRKSNSLERYFSTLNAALRHGALFVTPDGEVDVDFEKFDSIAASMNPGCDAFDSSLPEASRTGEWRVK